VYDDPSTRKIYDKPWVFGSTLTATVVLTERLISKTTFAIS